MTTRVWVLVVLIASLFAPVSHGQSDRIIERMKIARTIDDESEFHALIETSLGGGHHYVVAESPFYIVDLQDASGFFVSTLFVYERMGNRLVLRAHLPGKINFEREVAFANGTLTIRELDRCNRIIRLPDAFYEQRGIRPPADRSPPPGCRPGWTLIAEIPVTTE